ncbi:MAG: cell division ATP-binding protein FtsE [Deltaproteobacteria bacterium]|nr:cell division ATP-binding protein FtsE [Deltaproteobacteria bacterium]
MIRAFHIYKYYQKGQVALVDINLRIEKGDFLFITGPSGAGKTTLLKLIYLREFPSSGQLLIEDKNVLHLKRKELEELRRHIGVVFQDFKLIPYLTVYENVALPLYINKEPEYRVRQRVFSALDYVGLVHKTSKFPLQLSGGEQQRIGIARAIVRNPTLLVADEPTGNLDYERAIEIMDMLLDMNTRGATVIVATHNLEIIKRYNKNTVYLKEGRIEER